MSVRESATKPMAAPAATDQSSRSKLPDRAIAHSITAAAAPEATAKLYEREKPITTGAPAVSAKVTQPTRGPPISWPRP